LKQTFQNECKADEFAVELMQRIGASPSGIIKFFTAALYLTAQHSDFDSDEKWKNYIQKNSIHPLSSWRIKKLAVKLKQSSKNFSKAEPKVDQAIVQANYSASQLEEIARIMDDPKIQRAIAHIGRTTNIAKLKPHPEDLLKQHFMEDNETVPSKKVLFAGIFKGYYALGQSPDGLPITVKFNRNGKHVTGSYAYWLGNGKIIGTVDGNRLYFKWKEGQNYGKGVFKAEQSGNFFSGTWGYDESNSNGGIWTGKRN
jgi:hypothetical protein